MRVVSAFCAPPRGALTPKIRGKSVCFALFWTPVVASADTGGRKRVAQVAAGRDFSNTEATVSAFVCLRPLCRSPICSSTMRLFLIRYSMMRSFEIRYLQFVIIIHDALSYESHLVIRTKD